MKRKSESKGLYAEQMVRVGLLSSNWAHERPNIKEIEFTAKHVGRVEIALYNGLNIYDLYRLPSGMYLVRTEFITTDETRAVITEPINVHKLQADFPELATETNLIPRVVLDEEGNEQQNIAEEKISDGIFDVFLCHNSTSKAFVKEIGIQLKNVGIRPWLDEWELQPGLPWQDLLEEQIQQIKSVAVLVGKEGIGPWQRQELRAFLSEFVDRGCPVIPVLLPDAIIEPSLPIFLRAMTWVDFRRKNPDPLSQLIWGITGQKPSAQE